MTNTYTHPNGYTVERDADGRVILDRDGDAWVTPETAAALRGYFLAELGLWRDNETGALVVPGSWDGSGAYVLTLGGGLVYGLSTVDIEGLSDAAAVARWRATLAPPPREPKPGEVWRITFPEGQERNALVSCVDGMTAFRWGGDWHPVDGWPADRRRLLVEADGTVVSDE